MQSFDTAKLCSPQRVYVAPSKIRSEKNNNSVGVVVACQANYVKNACQKYIHLSRMLSVSSAIVSSGCTKKTS
jgi:hypothetical protein